MHYLQTQKNTIDFILFLWFSNKLVAKYVNFAEDVPKIFIFLNNPVISKGGMERSDFSMVLLSLLTLS